MNWTDLLTAKVNETYHAIEGMLSLCDDASLGWKPATGANWMTTGQLIDHLTNAGGTCIAGFVPGNVGTRRCVGRGDATVGEKMPTTKRRRDAHEAGGQSAHVAVIAEQNLATKMVAAP
jgi:hypothetical protein